MAHFGLGATSDLGSGTRNITDIDQRAVRPTDTHLGGFADTCMVKFSSSSFASEDVAS